MIDLKWIIYAAIWLIAIGLFGLAFKRRISAIAISFLFLIIGVELILTSISAYVLPDNPSGPALAIISVIIFTLTSILGVMSSMTIWHDGQMKREFSLFAFKLTDIVNKKNEELKVE